jgi:predicted DNA-binding protein YlxM (UPF0122 family)
MSRNKALSSETRQSIHVLRNEGYPMREIVKKLKISYIAVYYSTEQCKLALTRIERGVGGPGAQLSKRTSTLVSSLRKTPHKSSTGSFIKWYPQNTSLNVNIEEANPECSNSRQKHVT